MPLVVAIRPRSPRASAPFTPVPPTPPPPPTPGGIEPNPAETAWTLGAGGAVASPSVAPGFAMGLATVLLNAGVVVPYTSGAVLDASVWRGGEEASLFSPAVAWIDATMGTLTLGIAVGQSSGLEQGKYRLQVGVTGVGGVRSLAYDGWLEVGDSPGNVAAPLAWCDYEDMLLYSDAIKSLGGSRGVDLTAFLAQRAEETAKRSREMVIRYRQRPGYTRVRQSTPDPIIGQDPANAAAVALSKGDLTTALATVGGIVLEEKLREIIARGAIALVLGRQTTVGNSQAYRQEAAEQRSRADELFKCYQAQIHTASPIVSPSPIGPVSDFLIDRDCILLPPGTSP